MMYPTPRPFSECVGCAASNNSEFLSGVGRFIDELLPGVLSPMSRGRHKS
jgi:hypothetical protein